jgi:hypothetical protein
LSSAIGYGVEDQTQSVTARDSGAAQRVRAGRHLRTAVGELNADLVTLARRPELKPTPSDPNAPLLPDLDIDVN